MEKNWLIRTKSKQILGPVTKKKIIELIEKDFLAEEDEISSGNGYWFWVRERELLEKYVYGEIPQTFNPVSEVMDVLSVGHYVDGTASIRCLPNQNLIPQVDDVQNLPKDSDLDYPDLDGDLGNDKTDPLLTVIDDSILSLHTDQKNIPDQIEAEDGVEGRLPESDELEYPDIGQAPTTTSVELAERDEVDDNATREIKMDDLGNVDALSLKNEIPVLLDSDENEVPVLLDSDENEVPVLLDSDENEGAKKSKKEEIEKSKKHGREDKALEKSKEKSIVKNKKLNRFEIRYAKKQKKLNKKKTSSKNGLYLFYIFLLLAIIVGAVIFYYNKVLNRDILKLLLSDAQSQVITSHSGKKKV